MKNRIIGVTALIVRKNKLLCIVRKSKIFKGMISLPGGKLKVGEDPTVGLIREVREETGYLIGISSSVPLVEDEIEYGGQTALIKVYEARIIGGKERKQKDEISEILWATAAEYLDSLRKFKFPDKTISGLSEYFLSKGLIF